MKRLAWLPLFALCPLLLLASPPRAEDDLAKELPRIPGQTPAEALQSFSLHKGFRLEPVATEPVVTDPVAVSYDADGRLYVVEMRGYPYPENTPSGNVSLIEDTNKDGTFDKRTIFFDGISWPTGVLTYNGGVFVTVPPNIWFAKDTNGDGLADEKKLMFSGFGTQNVQGLLNSLVWGLDGWVYGSAGSNGGEIKNETHPDLPLVSVRGRDFRFKPDGSAFEAISGGGQFGHGFDDWGHRFVCNNSNHIRQIILPSHYLERNKALTVSSVIEDIPVEGGAGPVYRISSAEPWRVVRTRQRKADPVLSKKLAYTELFATGFFTSATGVTIYRGSAYPEEYRGNAFIGDVGGNLVHRKYVNKNGAIFAAKRADENVEFLASKDNWFRPVNFANTPDGTLLILDMYRETIEHPASIPEPIKKHLDLTSGKDRGRLYELVPESPKFQHRFPRLSQAKTSELVALLADGDAWWRETAQRLLLERNDRSAIPALVSLAKSRPTALGRLHALWTLADLGALEPALVIDALSDPEPGVRENAAKLAEPLMSAHAEVASAVMKLAEDGDAMVRMQAAFSLGAAKDPRALEALARIALRDPASRWTRAAVLSSIGGRAPAFLVELVKQGGHRSAESAAWLEDAGTLVGTEGQLSEVTAFLKAFVADPQQPAARAALLGLSRGLGRSGRSLANFKDPVLEEVFTAAERQLAGSGDLTARIDSARLLAHAPADRAIPALDAALDPRQPATLQVAALQALGDVKSRKVADVLIKKWKGLSPSVRREAMETLLARTERVDALLDAVAAGTIPAASIEPDRRARLLATSNPSLRERAKQLLGSVPKSDRQAVIANFRPALSLTGDAEKGKAVFRTVCATCHKAEGFGQDVGPNLATIVGRSPEDLLIHILDPNREVAPNFLSYNVALDDGRVVSGLIADESANAITLKRAEGASDVIPRGRIEQIASSGLSLMPEGLEKNQTPQDFANLIAYLKAIAPR